MIEVVTIQALWDGSRLEIRPVYGQGWELLTSDKRPIGKRQSMSVVDVDSVTAFQLEASFYAAMREVGDHWDLAQRNLHADAVIDAVTDGPWPESLTDSPPAGV